MGSRMTIQLVLVVVALVIIFSYIKPTFSTMQETQDQTKEYRTALDNAARFNQELQRLVQQANNFSTSQRALLDRYLPEEIDTIAVMRDIETIVNDNRLDLLTLTSAKEAAAGVAFTPAQGQSRRSDSSGLSATSFEVSISGTYNQFKSFLQDIERNAYPLEASNVTVQPTETEPYTFSLTLETYAFSSVSDDSN